MEDYVTVAGPATDSFVEKRSRFIGEIRPVSREEEATAFIGEKKSAHWDASHNCSAYILRAGGVQRYSDDGEPQGTAGIPILEVLRKEGLQDVAIVVTRYFGGTLLGAGGLVRAYTRGAKIAIDAARRVVICSCVTFTLETPYPLYDRLALLLADRGASVLDTDYGAAVTIRARLREGDYSQFAEQLTELSGGKVTPYDLENGHAPMA